MQTLIDCGWGGTFDYPSVTVVSCRDVLYIIVPVDPICKVTPRAGPMEPDPLSEWGKKTARVD